MKRFLLVGLALLISSQVSISQDTDTTKGNWLISIDLGFDYDEPYEYRDPYTFSQSKSNDWSSKAGIAVGFRFSNPWEIGTLINFGGSHGDLSLDLPEGRLNTKIRDGIVEIGPYYRYNFFKRISKKGVRSEIYQHLSLGYHYQYVKIESSIENNLVREGTREGHGVYWNLGLGYCIEILPWMEVHYFVCITQSYNKNNDLFDNGWEDNFPSTRTVYTVGMKMRLLFNNTFMKFPKSKK